MTIFGLLSYPLRAYQSMRDELHALRKGNLLKLAILHERIESGEINGSALDAVTECLEAQSVNIKKRDTKHLNGGAK